MTILVFVGVIFSRFLGAFWFWGDVKNEGEEDRSIMPLNRRVFEGKSVGSSSLKCKEKMCFFHIHFKYRYINIPYKQVFPKIRVPQNEWFIMENPIEMDDLGGKPHYFWKHPY